MEPQPNRSAVVCPECQAPFATIEQVTTLVVWFRCPACEHRWVAEAASIRDAVSRVQAVDAALKA